MMTLLVVVILLLTFTTSAAAECAWVLWEREELRGWRATFATAEWMPVRGFQSSKQCEEEANKEAKAVTTKDGWQITGPLSTGTASAPRRCLPDTIDPRGPKGK